MFIKLWERYFIREFCKTFFLFLFCFYGLYVLIDYASHTSALPHHQTQIHGNHLARYYFYIFAARMEILIPVALLIAFVKTVCQLNMQQELVAFMAGGFRIHTLMRPFIAIGCLCTLLMFLNEQFVLPTALKKLRRIEDSSKSQKARRADTAARQVILEDGTLLIYQSYDTANELFFDAYWVESIDSIFRIKHLSPHTDIPMGHYVDHIARDHLTGELIQQASYTYRAFPQIQFSNEVLQSAIIEPDVLPIAELFTQYLALPNELSEKESKLATAFYWKLFVPWLCLFAIMAPAPYCIRFSRQFPVFLIYIASLFGLISLYLLLDAAQVVAKRQLLDPFLAIGVPIIGIFLCIVWKFAKLR